MLTVASIVQKNPDITYSEARQQHPNLKFTTGSFYSARFRFRLGSSKHTEKTVNKQTLTQKLLSLLESSSQGVTSEDITKILRTTYSSMYTSIYYLKNHNNYTIKGEILDSICDTNFVTLPNKMCVMVDDEKVVLFKDNNQKKEISNAPFDSSMKLYNDGMKVLFIDDNKLYSVSMK